MNEMTNLKGWRFANVASELREVRKLINILQVYGNVIVNGGISVSERMYQLIEKFKENDINLEDCQQGLIELENYYPAKSQ